jgi:hypothetical protein
MTYEEARLARQLARKENQKAAAEIAERNNVPNPFLQQPSAPHPSLEGPSAAELLAAGREFARRCAKRPDSFAAKSSEAAFDIAAKLARFGSFASPAQAGYAEKLVVWAKVREQRNTVDQYAMPAVHALVDQNLEETRQAARAVFHVERPAPAPALSLPVPQLAALLSLDRFARLVVGRLVFTLKNDGSVVWVKRGPTLVGKILGGVFTTTRDGHSDRDELFVVVGAIEADPVRALEDHGLKTGRCGCCSRPLTNPVSIARGIGPDCAAKGGW